MNLLSAENWTDVITIETIHAGELFYSSPRECNESSNPSFVSLITPQNTADDFKRRSAAAEEERSLVEMLIICGLMCACILTTIIGNLLVVVSVLTYPPLKCPPQNHFLVSLACADLAVAILVMPWHVVTFTSGGRWPLGASWCRAWLTCDILTCTSSILHLCVIALDRYNAIHDPIRYAVKRTLRRIVVKIAAVWAASAFISVPPLIGWNGGSAGDPLYDVAEKRCHFTDEKGFVVYSALGSFFIPLMVMSFLYVKIFLATRARLRARVRSLHSGLSKRLHQPPPPRKPDDASQTVDYIPIRKVKDQSHQDSGRYRTTPSGRRQIPIMKTSSIPETEDHTTPKIGSHPSQGTTGNPTTGARDRSTPDIGSHNTHADTGGSRFRRKSCGTAKTGNRLKSKVSLSAKSVSSDDVLNDAHSAVVSPDLVTTNQEVRRPTIQLLCCKLRLCRVGEDTTEGSQVSRFIEARHRLSLSRERRAARTAGIVVGAFVICWLPFFLVYLIFPFCDRCAARAGDGLVRLVVWLGYLNSSLNPIIYTVFNIDFRKAFKGILLCLCRRVTKIRSFHDI